MLDIVTRRSVLSYEIDCKLVDPFKRYFSNLTRRGVCYPCITKHTCYFIHLNSQVIAIDLLVYVAWVNLLFANDSCIYLQCNDITVKIWRASVVPKV